jgi:hypothetical protein
VQGSGEDNEDSEDNEDPPADFQGDLQVPIRLPDDEQPTLPFAEAEDEVLQSVCTYAGKACERMVYNYSKAHTID